MLFLQYILLAIIVVYSASQAAKMVDELDKKTKVGGAIIGGILLAAITSLPELITSLSATVIYKEPGLAFGNILGSNLFNIVIIAIADLYFIKKLFLNRVSNSKKTVLFSIIMYVLMIVPLVISSISDVATMLPVSIISLLILIIYFANIKSLLEEDVDPNNGESTHTLKKILLIFIFWAIVLVVTSILVTGVTKNIADELDMQASFAGALFLGIATSLPELTSVITLIRLKNYNAAIANAVGSNVLNFAILSFIDLVYIKENIYHSLFSDKELLLNVIFLLLLGLFNSILLLVALTRKNVNNRVLYVMPSFFIIVAYILYLVVSV